MRRLIAAAIFLALAVHGSANAETYPARPITLVVPFANGGGSDIIARIVAKAMQSKLGQPVIVENTDGAGGMVGTNRVVKAAPDGYTFLFAQSGITASTTNNPRQIDLISSSLKPIGLVANEPYLIIARNNLPAKGLKELVQWLQENQRNASSSVAVGTHSHLASILFQEATGTKFRLVLSRGEQQSIDDVVAGKNDVLLSSPIMSMRALGSGSVKALAVTAKEWIKIGADIPTTDEAGLPRFYFSRWYAFWCPRGTPDDIVAKLNEAMVRALDDSEVTRQFAAIGLQRFPAQQLRPDALVSYQKDDFYKWLPVLRALSGKMRRA